MTDKENNTVYRILVIDDNMAIHEDFRKILTAPASSGGDLEEMEAALFGTEIRNDEGPGFAIDCASQGKEGLEMVRRALAEGRPYALAFVDGRMPPGWDGIETIGRLWQASPDLQIVLCTAYSDYSWSEIRRKLGDSDSMLILKKPFDNVEVLQLAHALTRKWELTRQVRDQIENLDGLVAKRTREKERTRALLEAALEHSPAGIVIVDVPCEQILWANPAASCICNPACLFSSPMAGDDSPRDWQAFRMDGTPFHIGEGFFDKSASAGATVKDEEIVLRDASGRETWISLNAGPVADEDDTIIAGILVFQDITGRKRSENEKEKLKDQLGQARKMESVGLLAGGIAHDFNNMLAVILGQTEIAAERTDSPESTLRSLKEIQKAAERSRDLTKQLLAFARKQTVVPRVLDLNAQVEGTIAMMKRLIGENIRLWWKPQNSLWPVRIDPSQVDQIMANLCINARDAIESVGKLNIETKNVFFDDSYCALRNEFQRGHYVMLAVIDDGCGIAKEDMEHIFEPFFTTKEVGKGTGMGLATVYGIVKQNNGIVDVESEPGKGAAFRIYLPRFEGGEKADAPEEDRTPKEGLGETVLVVEDETSLLEMSQEMLEQLGYFVLAARAPEDAIRQADESGREINLLITDVVMPQMNGRELADKLIASHPNVKVLFMSGYPADVIGNHGVVEEGVSFIQKPFSFKDFAEKIRAALDSD